MFQTHFSNIIFYRFVQRFRQQPPAPRDQREQKNGKEFWWLRKGRIPLSVATSTKQVRNVIYILILIVMYVCECQNRKIERII